MAIARKEEAEYNHYKPEEVRIIGDRAVRFKDICVHRFRMSDVEDPDVWAGQSLWEWQQSEAGQWVIENAEEKPYWTRSLDHQTYGHIYKIMARLSEQNITYFKLKFQK